MGGVWRPTLLAVSLVGCGAYGANDFGDAFAVYQKTKTCQQDMAADSVSRGPKKLNLTIGLRKLHRADNVSLETTMKCTRIEPPEGFNIIEMACKGTTADTMKVHHNEHMAFRMADSKLTIDGSFWVFGNEFQVAKTCHACGESCNITVEGITWSQKLPTCWSRDGNNTSLAFKGHDLPLEVPLHTFENLPTAFKAGWSTDVYEKISGLEEVLGYDIAVVGGYPDM
eukprot:CAMPEP_0171168684 /NCGR_PEP_ID=MMETSP0790-20130122/7833_1 /TAXON_ID=2925 /ORGANISM="Alexandrium catenella, Strain OF101" /LENGTH=225 /DNA_ID=CAMNT_0011633523 /DNA_START=53 /DNA_END=730 /DNA_ORIENTATION=-